MIAAPTVAIVEATQCQGHLYHKINTTRTCKSLRPPAKDEWMKPLLTRIMSRLVQLTVLAPRKGNRLFVGAVAQRGNGDQEVRTTSGTRTSR
jgi:hypothetical protein